MKIESIRNVTGLYMKRKESFTSIPTYTAGVMQASVNRLLQKYCDEVLSQYGITKNQWLIIGSVLEHGKKGIRLTELAEIIDTTLSYLTTTINLLESKNILVRESDQGDTRAKLISIHPKFKPKCQEIEITLRASLREYVYYNISPEDFKVYMKVIGKLSKTEERLSKNQT